MFRLRLSERANDDIAKILEWSHSQFGASGQSRYEALIFVALRDIARDPWRLGARLRPDLGEDVYVYHLRHSRTGLTRRRSTVAHPRHYLVYRRTGNDLIVVGRVLHDSMDLGRHLSPEFEYAREGDD